MSRYLYFRAINILILLTMMMLNGCGSKQLTYASAMPHSIKNSTIAVYPLRNYTDTPRAGLRAANIIEGVLLSKGYKVIDRTYKKQTKMNQKAAMDDAKRYGAAYILSGGVSEWRYKTGIDGEPAISLHIKLIDSKNGHIVWSVTGADSSWGNDSIGVVAQQLISDMIPSLER